LANVFHLSRHLFIAHAGGPEALYTKIEGVIGTCASMRERKKKSSNPSHDRPNPLASEGQGHTAVSKPGKWALCSRVFSVATSVLSILTHLLSCHPSKSLGCHHTRHTIIYHHGRQFGAKPSGLRFDAANSKRTTSYVPAVCNSGRHPNKQQHPRHADTTDPTQPRPCFLRHRRMFYSINRTE
jgi:hypothetical protein